MIFTVLSTVPFNDLDPSQDDILSYLTAYLIPLIGFNI